MPENPKKLFVDVSANRTDSSRGELDAGRAIQRHCSGKTRDDYLNDEMLRSETGGAVAKQTLPANA